jgi:hypothetical protein
LLLRRGVLLGVACPLTFVDDTAAAGFRCEFTGTLLFGCNDAIRATFVVSVNAVTFTFGTSKMVYAIADSPTETHTNVPFGGGFFLSEDGRFLTGGFRGIPPFEIAGCPFTFYTGTFARLVPVNR